MVNITGDLLSLYTAEIDTSGDTYTVEIPKREVELGGLNTDEPTQVALFGTPTTTTAATESQESPQPAAEPHRSSAPPVDEGDLVDVEIDSLGDQGDGIGRVGPGYVIIVPDTDVGERVNVRVTETKENVAFAEVVKRYDTGY
ncbi:MAG: putative RNA-binding protein, contains TRAM domain protein [Halonotius sp. J07HN4]|jgi:Predicted RNA-binding protein, contains TRAM domain|nr:MAG: putative RNA-binding protein, contains TRAM domain protein [Halonotius sp. J07HN4]